MTDRYSQLVRLPVAGGVAKRIGLPQPVELERGPGELSGRVLLGGAGRMAEAAARVLADIGADAATALDDPVRALAASAGLDAAVFNPEAPADQRFKALVFDATGAELVELHRFIRRCGACCRPGAWSCSGTGGARSKASRARSARRSGAAPR